MKSVTEIVELHMKKLQGEISEEEEKELDEWVNHSPKNKEAYHFLTNIGAAEVFLFDESISDEEYRKITDTGHNNHEFNNEQRTSFKRLACFSLAASLVIVVNCLFYYKYTSERIRLKKFDIHGKWIGLGQTDGSMILLDSARDLPLPDQGDYRLPLHDEELLYKPLKQKLSKKDQNVFNTIMLPEGRRFKVVLPDGSLVWLNAASSIRFPVSGNRQERTLELMGEAYFEIKKDAARPFIVKVKTSTDLSLDIMVTGTKFNVNAYCDDAVIRTTLVEGSIIIKKGGGATALRSGEEMLMGKGISKKRLAKNVSEVTAWKDNFFEFKDASVQNVVNEIGRWYGWVVMTDAEVTKPISLSIPRSMNFDSILHIICNYSGCFVVKKDHGQVRLKKNK